MSGRNTTEYDFMENLCPVLLIDSPSKEWRDQFISKNINVNMYEQILSVHPVFVRYNLWRESRSFVVGYHPQNEYQHDDLCQYSVHDLAEGGILKGMDTITVRLCKHFGFKIRKYMQLDLDEVHDHDEILIRNIPFGYRNE